MKKLLIAAFSLFSIYAGAQVTEPTLGRNYQIISGEGFALGSVDGVAKQCEPDENDETQAFEFIDSGDGDGSYMIKLVADDSYVCKITSDWNTWDISFEATLPSDVSRAKYTIEAIEGTEFVAIKNKQNSLYWGWDTPGVGNGVWCDKALNEKSQWKLVALATDAETLYNDAASRLLLFQEELGDYPGIQTEITDFAMAEEEKIDGTDDTYYALITEINNYISEIRKGLAVISNISNIYDECDANFASSTLYPGFDALETAYYEAHDLFESDDAKLQELLDGYYALENALHAYYDSQIPVATEENPADLTYYIKYPNFREAYNYDPDCTTTSEGWVLNDTNLPSSGFDYGARHKYSDEVGVDVTCFNNWSWQFNLLEIYQDVEGLPDGRYKVECIGYTGVGENYKQHAFATSGGVTAVSNYASEAMSGAWETFETTPVTVMNGNLRIGFSSEASEAGGSIGWYLVTGFRLKYCGQLSEEDLRAQLNSKLDECRAQRDTMMFNADKVAFSDSISKYGNASDVQAIKDAIEALMVAQAEAQKSVDKQVAVKNGILAALTDSLTNGVYTDVYSEIANSFCESMTNAINAEDATYTEMDSLTSILYCFRDEYMPVLKEAKELEVSDAVAKSVLDENINRQVAFFTEMEVLPLETLVEKYITELENAIAACRAADLIATDTKDYTALIVNPTIDDSNSSSAKGWTIVMSGSGNNLVTNASQQYDGDVNGRYLDAWHQTAGNLLYNAYQTIENLPNGTYELKAMVRTTSDKGVYLYAMADHDSTTTVLAPVTMERMNITELGGPSDSAGNDSIATVSDSYGSIFAEAYKATNGGIDGDEALLQIVNTNNGKGWGWHYKTLEIEVKDHALTIGYTCDSTFTMKFGGEPWTGTWLSADNFTLTQLTEGDNAGWNPATGISTPEDDSEELDFRVENGTIIAPEGTLVYSVNGVRVDAGVKLNAGVYILKYGNKTAKVVVR